MKKSTIVTAVQATALVIKYGPAVVRFVRSERTQDVAGKALGILKDLIVGPTLPARRLPVRR